MKKIIISLFLLISLFVFSFSVDESKFISFKNDMDAAEEDVLNIVFNNLVVVLNQANLKQRDLLIFNYMNSEMNYYNLAGTRLASTLAKIVKQFDTANEEILDVKDVDYFEMQIEESNEVIFESFLYLKEPEYLITARKLNNLFDRIVTTQEYKDFADVFLKYSIDKIQGRKYILRMNFFIDDILIGYILFADEYLRLLDGIVVFIQLDKLI